MFAWIDGALTIEMATGKVGFIRCHSDPAKIPGNVDWSCAIEMQPDGTAEPKILHGTRGPTLAEIRLLAKYFQSIGYDVSWHRYINGKNPKKVKT